MLIRFLSDLWSAYSLYYSVHDCCYLRLLFVFQSHAASADPTLQVLNCAQVRAKYSNFRSFIESDGSAITICNILVMTCIIFSIPLALYPARSTLWKLIHTFMPSFPAVSFFLRKVSINLILAICSSRAQSPPWQG